MVDQSAVAGTIRLLYFAWLREKVGMAEERIAVPVSVETIGDLLMWQRSRGPEFADAFARPSVIRAAIDRTHAKLSASIAGAQEIAFFPPVTGG